MKRVVRFEGIQGVVPLIQGDPSSRATPHPGRPLIQGDPSSRETPHPGRPLIQGDPSSRETPHPGRCTPHPGRCTPHPGRCTPHPGRPPSSRGCGPHPGVADLIQGLRTSSRATPQLMGYSSINMNMCLRNVLKVLNIYVEFLSYDVFEE